MKLFFLDLETTGLDKTKHGIHQISGCVVINGVIKERFNFKVAPSPAAFIDVKALNTCGVTYEQIKDYPSMVIVFAQIKAIILKYINEEDPTDKFFICGYNSQKFDAGHFSNWFRVNGALKFFNNVFWNGATLDVMVLALAFIGNDRHKLDRFTQAAVALYLGIPVDPTKLHDAEYDIELCYLIYDKVYGKY